jgi:hypothetical protein
MDENKNSVATRSLMECDKLQQDVHYSSSSKEKKLMKK